MFRAAAAALLLLLAIPGADAMRHRAIGRSMARHQHAVAAKKASRADPTLLKGGWSLCPPSNAGCPSVIWSSSPGSGFSCPGESEQDKKTKREFVNDDIRVRVVVVVGCWFASTSSGLRQQGLRSWLAL